MEQIHFEIFFIFIFKISFMDVSQLAKVKWKGKWIWTNNVTARRSSPYRNRKIVTERYLDFKPEEINTFYLIRRNFELPNDSAKKLKKAYIDITADSRYRLFINGKFVGQGINRCEAYYWYYNRYDITKYLKPGLNVIAISAKFYGKDFAFYTLPELAGLNKKNSGKGAVLYEAYIEYEDLKNLDTANNEDNSKSNNNAENIIWIYSGDGKNKIIKNSAQKHDVAMKGDCLGFVEEFDSRKLDKNWNEVEYDDSNWNKPAVYDYPIKTLLLDENHPLFSEEVYPEKILSMTQLDDIRYEEDFDEEDLEDMDFCVMYNLEIGEQDIKDAKIENPNSLLSQNPTLPADNNHEQTFSITSNDKTKTYSILLKFPREMVGYVRLIAEGPPGTIIDVISTEKMEQGRLSLDFIDNKRGFRLILRGGKQFFEQWDWEGFLYTVIRVRDLEGTLKIHKFCTNTIHMQTTKKGEFVCNDEKVNELYEACAYTLLCCAIDGYLDCPSREQRSYLGDAYPEMMVANTCFGEPRLTKKLIMDTAFGQRKDGMTFSFHPGDYQVQCHIIPDYNFYWIQIAEQYDMWYDDTELLLELYPYFVKSVEWFLKYLDPEVGLLNNDDLPYWIFIDWSYTREKPGYNAIINTQFMDVLRIVAKYGRLSGDIRRAEKYEKIEKDLRTRIEQTFWDESEGCYRDYLKDGKLGGIVSQHTSSYLAIMGVAPKSKWPKILKRVFDDPGDDNDKKQIDDIRIKFVKHDKLVVDQSKDVLIAQPFFMHHVNRFFDLANRHDLMFKYIRKGWLPMLEIGETKTIWETWSKNGSECHAWCATPGYDLPTYVLGIRLKEKGFRKITIAPNPSGLTWAKGKVPTIKGDISVSWKINPINLNDKENRESEVKEFSISIEIPKGSSAEFKGPNPFVDALITEIIIDGEKVDGNALNNFITDNKQYPVEIPEINEGKHEIIVRWK